MNRWTEESAAIANSGECTCTEDESCRGHEALEMQAENEAALPDELVIDDAGPLAGVLRPASPEDYSPPVSR